MSTLFAIFEFGTVLVLALLLLRERTDTTGYKARVSETPDEDPRKRGPKASELDNPGHIPDDD